MSSAKVTQDVLMFYLWQSIAFRGIASMCLKAGQELGFQGKYGFVNEGKGTGTGKAAWTNTTAPLLPKLPCR